MKIFGYIMQILVLLNTAAMMDRHMNEGNLEGIIGSSAMFIGMTILFLAFELIRRDKHD